LRVIAIPKGKFPTLMGVSIVPVAVRMRVTVSDWELAT
jgi:hypothetical protein